MIHYALKMSSQLIYGMENSKGSLHSLSWLSIWLPNITSYRKGQKSARAPYFMLCPAIQTQNKPQTNPETQQSPAQ